MDIAIADQADQPPPDPRDWFHNWGGRHVRLLITDHGLWNNAYLQRRPGGVKRHLLDGTSAVRTWLAARAQGCGHRRHCMRNGSKWRHFQLSDQRNHQPARHAANRLQ